jgi:hypothetical protein
MPSFQPIYMIANLRYDKFAIIFIVENQAFFHFLNNISKSRDSSVGMATGYGLDDCGSRVRFPAVLGIFFITVSLPSLGPTQPPIQCITGALSPGVKRPEREADHSPPTGAEVKNTWSHTSTLPIFLLGVVIK